MVWTEPCLFQTINPNTLAQIASQVIANMFDGGSISPSSLLVLNMVTHSGISKKLFEVPWCSQVRMLSLDRKDKKFGLQGKAQQEAHDCCLPFGRLINQKKREVSTKLHQEILEKLVAENKFDIQQL